MRERQEGENPYEIHRIRARELELLCNEYFEVLNQVIDLPYIRPSVVEAYRISTNEKKEPIRYSNGRYHYEIHIFKWPRRATFWIDRASINESSEDKEPEIVESFRVVRGLTRPRTQNMIRYTGTFNDGDEKRDILQINTRKSSSAIREMLEDLQAPPTRIVSGN